MSSKGIYTALSGALAQSQRLDTIANNLANVNTPTFKRDQQVFREYLTAAEKQPDVLQVPRIPASVESFYDMQGGDRGYVDANGTYSDFSQGLVKPTGNNFDLAIEGRGMFEVFTPNGVMVTRNGSFRMDQEGRLVTKEGYPVLMEGAAGGDAAQRVLKLSGNNLTVGSKGEIYEGDTLRGRLALVDVDNLEGLQKVGSSLYQAKPNYNMKWSPAAGELRQGALEGSNVNVVAEMTDMIAASRTFESAKEAMKTFDKMDDKLVNEVPRTS